MPSIMNIIIYELGMKDTKKLFSKLQDPPRRTRNS